MKGKKEKHARADLPREIGVIHKTWKNRLSVALVYPNHYGVGTANLGFQTVYRLLNEMDRVVCERAFLPEEKDGNGAHPPKTLESGRALTDFDIVAFSVSFELDYLHILTILDLAGLPLRSDDRKELHPLVVAGGVACWLNPEPIASFFDLIFIGEAEVLLPTFIQSYLKEGPQRGSPSVFVETIAPHIPGVYVPALYRPVYDTNGAFIGRRVSSGIPDQVQRMILRDLTESATHSVVVSSQAVFDSRYLIEIGRGCSRGCRFCSSGFISRPPRFRSIPALVADIKKGKKMADRIGLVGTAVSDLPGIESLCRQAAAMDVSLAFSSFRADALSEAFIDAMVKSGVKTATIAPDAGSERMRRVINKGLTEEDILKSTAALVSAGIANLKLYFMVGLPLETEADVLAIVALTEAIKKIFLRESRPRGKMGKITVSLNCFVPKPFTPFQWAAMDNVSLLKKKIMTIRKGIGRIPNLVFRSESPRQAYLQALLARGDRRIGQALLAAHRHDGDWPSALAEVAFNPDDFVYRRRDILEPLPWDFIDTGVRRSFLVREYKKALEACPSDPCPAEACTQCGACPN